MTDKTSLEYISDIQDFIDLHDFLQEDADFLEALDMGLKCIAKPDLPPAIARQVMVQMQGYAMRFKMQHLVYMQIHTGRTGSIENVKKNAYAYMSDQCHNLAQTLKYLVRENF